MGALMVVDPQHTARYQPAGLYINRGAPKKRRLVRGRKTKKNQREHRGENHQRRRKGHERQGTRNTETKKTQERREQKEENRELNPALV